MMRLVHGIALTLLATTLLGPLAAQPTKPRAPREALQVCNDLIGSWRCTCIPEGKRDDFWQETQAWSWQFKGDDAWLTVSIAKGKHFTQGEIRYLADKDRYRLTLTTPAKKTLTYEGSRGERKLIFERTDEQTQTQERFTFNLLHSNRFVCSFETKAADKALYRMDYKVGATKEGVAFAVGDNQPECIVSGGQGTMPITYKGKTYYVCCSGCRTEFNADPEKYIREAASKKKP